MRKKSLFLRLINSTTVRVITLSYAVTGQLINGLALFNPEAAGHLAYLLFGWTHRLPRNGEERALLATARRHHLKQDGRDLAVLSWGQGPTVLLVHGWNGWGTQMAAFIQPLLEAGYRVVTYDAKAHGDSQGHHTNLFQFAEGIKIVADHFGELHGIITHSIGGAATTQALSRGLGAKRVVYLSPPIRPQGWAEHFSKRIRLTHRGRKAFFHYLEENFGERWRQVNTQELEKTMSARLLVIHDVEDKETSTQGSQKIVAAWPEAELVLTRGLGHYRILKDPAVIQMAVDHIKTESELRPQPNSSQKGDYHETPYRKSVERNSGTVEPELAAGTAQH